MIFSTKQMSEEMAYESMLYIGLSYIIDPKIKYQKKQDLKNLDKMFKNCGAVSFIDYVIKELGFSNITEAKNFGRHIRTYWNNKKTLPEGLPHSDMIRKILTDL